MNRIVLIVLYFGSFPSTYQAWENTVLQNAGFDFLLITDNKEITSKKNLSVRYMKFADLKSCFEKKLRMPIVLEEPYKLCDYRPAYGFLFSEYIKDYEFWGYCDMDVLFGDLSHFITDHVLNQYDKILEHGHLTCYRNTKEINEIFMADGTYPEYNCKEVFQSPESYYFDECYGMMLKCRRLKIRTWYDTACFVDIHTKVREFVNAVADRKERCVFHYRKGKLYACYENSSGEEEIAYAHFQKRNMDFGILEQVNIGNEFWIVPNQAVYSYYKNEKGLIPTVKNHQYKMKRKLQHILDFGKRYRKVKDNYYSVFTYYQSRQRMKVRRKKADELIGSGGEVR